MKAESLGRKQGSSILEVLIALSVLTLGIAASAMLTFANQTLKLDSDTANVALYKDKDFLEEATLYLTRIEMKTRDLKQLSEKLSGF